MVSVMDRFIEATVGIILLAVAGGVLATQNAETLGGALSYLVAGFIPVALGVALLVRAFGAARV